MQTSRVAKVDRDSFIVRKNILINSRERRRERYIYFSAIFLNTHTHQHKHVHFLCICSVNYVILSIRYNYLQKLKTALCLPKPYQNSIMYPGVSYITVKQKCTKKCSKSINQKEITSDTPIGKWRMDKPQTNATSNK